MANLHELLRVRSAGTITCASKPVSASQQLWCLFFETELLVERRRSAKD